MSKEKDSAAFPQSGFDRWAPESGMTLRDYFAAKAMHAAIASQLHDGGDVPEEKIPKFFEIVAGYAYVAADAMLVEREK